MDGRQTAAAFTSPSSADLVLEAQELSSLAPPAPPSPPRQGRLSIQFSQATGLQSCGIYIPHPRILSGCKRDRAAGVTAHLSGARPVSRYGSLSAPLVSPLLALVILIGAPFALN